MTHSHAWISHRQPHIASSCIASPSIASCEWNVTPKELSLSRILVLKNAYHKTRC